MTVTGLHHVSLTVADLDRSLAFYRDLLGIAVREQVEMAADVVSEVSGEPARRVRIADLDLGDGRVLELVCDLDRGPVAHGGAHIALAVDDVWAVYRRLVDAGFAARSEPVTLGADAGLHWERTTVVWITDPDGATVELVQPAAA